MKGNDRAVLRLFLVLERSCRLGEQWFGLYPFNDQLADYTLVWYELQVKRAKVHHFKRNSSFKQRMDRWCRDMYH